LTLCLTNSPLAAGSFLTRVLVIDDNAERRDCRRTPVEMRLARHADPLI
jgi:hypothetical protein